jgi:tetrahydrodipicolinate N-succinyltransferase
MSKRWEEAVENWYNTRVRLEYLDLANIETPTNRDLAHNISVLYDRLNLHSRVSIKNQVLVVEELSKINEKLHKSQLISFERKLSQHLSEITLSQQKIQEKVDRLENLIRQLEKKLFSP